MPLMRFFRIGTASWERGYLRYEAVGRSLAVLVIPGAR